MEVYTFFKSFACMKAFRYFLFPYLPNVVVILDPHRITTHNSRSSVFYYRASQILFCVMISCNFSTQSSIQYRDMKILYGTAKEKIISHNSKQNVFNKNIVRLVSHHTMPNQVLNYCCHLKCSYRSEVENTRKTIDWRSFHSDYVNEYFYEIQLN